MANAQVAVEEPVDVESSRESKRRAIREMSAQVGIAVMHALGTPKAFVRVDAHHLFDSGIGLHRFRVNCWVLKDVNVAAAGLSPEIVQQMEISDSFYVTALGVAGGNDVQIKSSSPALTRKY